MRPEVDEFRALQEHLPQVSMTSVGTGSFWSNFSGLRNVHWTPTSRGATLDYGAAFKLFPRDFGHGTAAFVLKCRPPFLDMDPSEQKSLVARFKEQLRGTDLASEDMGGSGSGSGQRPDKDFYVLFGVADARSPPDSLDGSVEGNRVAADIAPLCKEYVMVVSAGSGDLGTRLRQSILDTFKNGPAPVCGVFDDIKERASKVARMGALHRGVVASIAAKVFGLETAETSCYDFSGLADGCPYKEQKILPRVDVSSNSFQIGGDEMLPTVFCGCTSLDTTHELEDGESCMGLVIRNGGLHHGVTIVHTTTHPNRIQCAQQCAFDRCLPLFSSALACKRSLTLGDIPAAYREQIAAVSPEGPKEDDLRYARSDWEAISIPERWERRLVIPLRVV